MAPHYFISIRFHGWDAVNRLAFCFCFFLNKMYLFCKLDVQAAFRKRVTVNSVCFLESTGYFLVVYNKHHIKCLSYARVIICLITSMFKCLGVTLGLCHLFKACRVYLLFLHSKSKN